MISINVRVRDGAGKWRYHKFNKVNDEVISLGEISDLTEKISRHVECGDEPEIKYEVKFNRYLGCVSGIGGVWVRMIDNVRAQRIVEHIVSQINTAVVNNKKQLGIGKAV